MDIQISGEFIDSSINSDTLSTPKVILYFTNGIEDRRIPLAVKSGNIIRRNGKCSFWGMYSYRLDLLFWKTRNKNIPCELYFNLSFADYYEEKVAFDITPKVFKQDKRFFLFKSCDNHFEITKNIIKLETDEKKNKIGRLLSEVVKICALICSVIFIPFFLVEALLYFKGFGTMPKRIETDNKFKRILSYIVFRMSVVSKKKLTADGYKRSLIRLVYKFKKRKKIVDNKITFFSARREEISGNFEFVYNKIKDDKNLDINFLFNTKNFRYMSFKEICEFAEMCATSKVIVLDEFTPQIHLIDLKPETKLIQLWHACGAFKTFGFTRIGKPKGSPQPTRNHRSYDYVTVSSEYCKKCHSEGFGISTNNVVPTGIARTDIFFDQQYIKNFKEDFYNKYPNLKDKKIILFAPTFRGHLKATANYPMDLFNVASVCKTLGEDYAVIIKHHPFITTKHHIPKKFRDRVIDLSNETEINDLLFISDVIITDYSSLVFEASIVNVPMLFYAYDLKSYIRARDFYFDFEKHIPGKICTNFEDLMEAIQNEDFESEKIAPFRDMFFDNLDGKSSQRIADLIYKCLD